MQIAFFDTKPYDKTYFSKAISDLALEIKYFEFRLDVNTSNLAEGCDAICAFVNDRLDRQCIEKLSEIGIQHIALRCAGFNNVDLDAAKEFLITVTRVPAYSPYAVAEHTIALLLTLNRQIHRAYNRVREHNFSLTGLVGFDLHGKTAGIIGTGKIGKLTAQTLTSFGCKVLAHDLNKDETWASKHGITYESFVWILKHCDIISLHLPLTPQTHHLINNDSISQMKSGCYIINTGRGKLIDTHALISALKSGHLGGVALDVYEEEEGVFFEDLSDEILQDDELSRLLTFPNVLITSHQGFLTREALNEIAHITCENLHRKNKKTPFLEGTQLV